jgi:hypothetical protein
MRRSGGKAFGIFGCAEPRETPFARVSAGGESAVALASSESDNHYSRVGGSAALIAETLSRPAILQIGCEKSVCKLGSATRP